MPHAKLCFCAAALAAAAHGLQTSHGDPWREEPGPPPDEVDEDERPCDPEKEMCGEPPILPDGSPAGNPGDFNLPHWLLDAASQGHSKRYRELLEMAGDHIHAALLHARDPHGMGVLHKALEGAFYKVVQEHPTSFMEIVNATVEAADWLVAPDPDGMAAVCPLFSVISLRVHAALLPIIEKSNPLSVRECLYEREANNHTVLMIAARSQASGMARLFRGHPRGMTQRQQDDLGLGDKARGPVSLDFASLTEASGTRDFDVLLDAGADPWLVDSFGRNCLHIAAMEGRVPIVKKLLDKPESVHYKDRLIQGGWSARALAAEQGFLEIASKFGPEGEKPPVPDALVQVPPGGWEHQASGGYTQSSAAAAYDMHSCDIDILDCDRMSSTAFNDSYLAPMRPALLAGCAKHWPAVQRWARDSLVELFGDVKVDVGGIAFADAYGGRGRTIPLKELVRNSEAAAAGKGGFEFAFDSHFAEKTENQIDSDYEKPFFAHNFETVLTEFSFGPPLSGANTHFHGAVFSGVVHGRKRWGLIPPAYSYFNTVPGKQWFDSAASKKPFVKHCVQRAGDVLFLPRNWGHTTLNIQTTVAIVTEF
eukprot:TRINITY_DN30849_c0_g1_i1.p1 TRINITY_DN30849_c0_g1~~TRINITY_DN30849_c0_g1_i1.p1  ORF type:complete len:630 (+),score=140.60 TRINITY_DN30849_c0_g1_i1:114-1892(+)